MTRVGMVIPILWTVSWTVGLGAALAAEASAPAELAGVWAARRSFGPDVRGELLVRHSAGVWEAEIAGYRVEGVGSDEDLVFELPGGRGELRVGRSPRAGRLSGHWIQARSRTNGSRYATPIALEGAGEGAWRGSVAPFEDRFTFYLVLTPRPDGTLGAFFRNPERNLGVFLDADRLELDGKNVRLIGTSFRGSEERVLAEGVYREEAGQLSLFLWRGPATYDFERLEEPAGPGFYARGESPGAYRYRPPPAGEDGWSVGTLEEVGLSFEPIRELIEKEVDPPADSVHDPYLHGLLIARHGKLVFEDYFHGYDRQTTHDTRSASKSMTAALVGAAIQAGEDLRLTDRVYDVVYGEARPEGFDSRKNAMTVEHLLTMSSGFDCDDQDPSSPGAEDGMWEQEREPDFYRFTLALPMAREPGESAVYCSINPNLVGAVLEKVTGEWGADLLHRLIAEPLGIGRYHQNLTPTGQAYMGGGIQWLPRDFMKLGQLFLDGGTWRGKRLLPRGFVERAVSPIVELRGRGYGYLWWRLEYPYEDGTVTAFFAGGNGGQLLMGIPELDLLVATFAGNYSDRTGFRIQEEFVPRYILPAVTGRDRQ